ncbi:MAG: hypothetical protein AAGF12_06245 [Myxococcota bacterium]
MTPYVCMVAAWIGFSLAATLANYLVVRRRPERTKRLVWVALGASVCTVAIWIAAFIAALVVFDRDGSNHTNGDLVLFTLKWSGLPIAITLGLHIAAFVHAVRLPSPREG